MRLLAERGDTAGGEMGGSYMIHVHVTEDVNTGLYSA